MKHLLGQGTRLQCLRNTEDDGQGGLACCNSWGRKELDMTEWLIWTELKQVRAALQCQVGQTKKISQGKTMVIRDGEGYWWEKAPKEEKRQAQTNDQSPFLRILHVSGVREQKTITETEEQKTTGFLALVRSSPNWLAEHSDPFWSGSFLLLQVHLSHPPALPKMIGISLNSVCLLCFCVHTQFPLSNVDQIKSTIWELRVKFYLGKMKTIAWETVFETDLRNCFKDVWQGTVLCMILVKGDTCIYWAEGCC